MAWHDVYVAWRGMSMKREPRKVAKREKAPQHTDPPRSVLEYSAQGDGRAQGRCIRVCMCMRMCAGWACMCACVHVWCVVMRGRHATGEALEAVAASAEEYTSARALHHRGGQSSDISAARGEKD